MTKIAVESTLGNVKATLQNNGFEVVDLNTTQTAYVPDVSVYVISGQDENVLGIANKQADIPVVNADGNTDQQVLEQVKQRVQLLSYARS